MYTNVANPPGAQPLDQVQLPSQIQLVCIGVSYIRSGAASVPLPHPDILQGTQARSHKNSIRQQRRPNPLANKPQVQENEQNSPKSPPFPTFPCQTRTSPFWLINTMSLLVLPVCFQLSRWLGSDCKQDRQVSIKASENSILANTIPRFCTAISSTYEYRMSPILLRVQI